MARYSLKKIAIVASLLGLIGPLLWLFLQRALEPTVFGATVSMCLALAVLNLWDQQRVSRKLALDDVEASRELMEKSQYRAALNRLESALAHDPTCFEVRVARGEIYRCEQAYDLARRELVEAIRIRPDSFRAHFALGLTYLQKCQQNLLDLHRGIDAYRQAHNGSFPPTLGELVAEKILPEMPKCPASEKQTYTGKGYQYKQGDPGRYTLMCLGNAHGELDLGVNEPLYDSLYGLRPPMKALSSPSPSPSPSPVEDPEK